MPLHFWGFPLLAWIPDFHWQGPDRRSIDVSLSNMTLRGMHPRSPWLPGHSSKPSLEPTGLPQLEGPWESCTPLPESILITKGRGPSAWKARLCSFRKQKIQGHGCRLVRPRSCVRVRCRQRAFGYGHPMPLTTYTSRSRTSTGLTFWLT
jgi:hypothetical protein